MTDPRWTPVAVVGRGCVLPGALDPGTFWDNVRHGRSALGPMPDARRDDVGGYVRDFASVFDPAGYGSGGARLAGLDPVFGWTAHAAGAALREAGHTGSRARSGLVMGNLSYPTTGLARFAAAVAGPHTAAPADPFDRFNSGLPAQLTAQVLGMGLGGLALDAACASSLYAVALACRRLARGDADLMVAGGINAADGCYVQDCFAGLEALSRSGRSRPFHRDADGLVPAQGAAFVALMRLTDALDAGLEVFGVIRGVGLSNDGRGSGLLVPSEDGQRRAMESAYRSAGLDPATVGLLECHATGTTIGDAVEIRSTARVFAGATDLPVGSVKANIGHAVTAAGAAGLLKVLGALSSGVRPPTPGIDVPTPELDGTPLRLLDAAEEWPGPRRAAVSAFGFGGNNAHLIVDAWTGDDGPAHVAAGPAGTPAPPAAEQPAAEPRVAEPVAVVAVGARVGDGDGTADLLDALMAGQVRDPSRASVDVALDGLRIPPLDLSDTIAQQLLVLEAAREAAASTTLARDTTMVLVGMGCDPEVAGRVELQGTGRAAQTVAAVIGAMPNVVANRINTQLDLAGPSFTVSAEEASGTAALQIGIDALREYDADAVLVGAVDLAAQPVHRAALAALGRTGPTGDAAVVLVLKRLADARAAQDTVLAVLDDGAHDADVPAARTVGDAEAFAGPGGAPAAEHLDPADLFGRAHAASGLLSVAVATLALHHRFRPRPGAPAVPALDAGSPLVSCGCAPLVGPPTVLRLRGADVAPPPVGCADGQRGDLRWAVYSGRDRAEVLAALEAGTESPDGPARLVLGTTGDPALAGKAAAWLRGRGLKPQGVAFRERPVSGEMAFVYAGGSMAHHGMGRELMVAFPDLLEPVARRCGPLEEIIGWAYRPGTAEELHPLDQIGAASVLGQLHTAISRDVLGLLPTASLGYSSGESTALAALGAWRDVRPLLVEARSGDLYNRLIVGELEVPRAAWRAAGVSGERWASHVVQAPVHLVEAALADEPVVHIMVRNAPDSCVFGGEAQSCERVLRRLGGVPTLPVPYAIAAHVPEVLGVREEWRRLHHLPTTEVPDVRFYTCATGESYRASADSAADAIAAQGLGEIDFGATVVRAWEDGVRVFVEHGPRGQCANWIAAALGDREHVAVSIDADEGRRLGQLVTVVAELIAAGVPVATDAPAARLGAPDRGPSGPVHTVAVRPSPPEQRSPRRAAVPPVEPAVMPPAPARAAAVPPREPARTMATTIAAPAGVAERVARPPALVAQGLAHMAAAHQHHLAVQAAVEQEFAAFLGRIAALAGAVPAGGGVEAAAASSAAAPSVGPVPQELPPPASMAPASAVPAPGPLTPGGTGAPMFDRADLERLATGPISALFGPMFAAQDGVARQTRMPSGPMLLADRVLGIDAEPGSMGTGAITTETDVTQEAWYLDPAGRMPAGIMVEAGQADLLLISWLGADLHNRGERVYRLLGLELTFHGSPLVPGETIRYEIRIDGHGEHGGTRLFFFHLDAFVDGELRLTLRDGQAGFFTDAELAATGGVLWDPAAQPRPSAAVRADPPAVAGPARAFTAEQVEAWAQGRTADCFGPAFDHARTHIRSPHLGEGRMRLLGSVTAYEPDGGPWGRGYLRAQTPVSPQDWFFDGHFPNDPCMPGNLMFDACLQAMAFHLAAGGHTLDRDGWRFEPATGAAFPMVCRGQVTPDSRLLTYEVFVSGTVAGPVPELVADVLCTVDGVAAFHVAGLALRLVPDWPLTHWRRLAAPAEQRTGTALAPREAAGLLGHADPVPVAEVDGFRFGRDAMLACAWGPPSEAFGPVYAAFDSHRRLARLPGPPFLFMSRVVELTGPAWVMQAGSAVEVEYDVPPQVWYFEQSGGPAAMPFGILMEVILQASGWLASYAGAALTSETDLLFRNLDGTATVHREVGPTTGVLRTRTRLTGVSSSGGMIIMNFAVECATAAGEPVVSLSTVFGFFPPSAFDEQVGIPPAAGAPALPDAPSSFTVDLAARPERYCAGALRMPGPMLLMLDRITGLWPAGGAAGLGAVRGESDVDAGEWFFRAHFFQDPVQPGSLGLQALVQLLQFHAIENDLGAGIDDPRFVPIAPGQPVTWNYRGQVTPRTGTVVAELELTSLTWDERGVRVVADGWLWADGIRIYGVRGLGIDVVAGRPIPMGEQSC